MQHLTTEMKHRSILIHLLLGHNCPLPSIVLTSIHQIILPHHDILSSIKQLFSFLLKIVFSLVMEKHILHNI